MPNVGDIIRASDIAEIIEESGSGGIIGEIIAYPGTTAPEGTLICDGSAISREAYSELFAIIGTNNGAGDGTSTFNIPDLRDKWVKYSGTENSVGDVLAEGLPNISGSIHSYAVRHAAANVANSGALSGSLTTVSNNIDGNRYNWSCLNYLYFNANTSNNIYGNSTHVTPNSIVLLPCIRYQ